MDRLFRMVGTGFLALGLTLLLIGLLAAPPAAFADEASCNSCLATCMNMGLSETECRNGACAQDCQETTCPGNSCNRVYSNFGTACYYSAQPSMLLQRSAGKRQQPPKLHVGQHLSGDGRN